jgi:hypothetical protein
MLLETVPEEPEAVGVHAPRTPFHVKANFHQRLPPISPLAQSCPSE